MGLYYKYKDPRDFAIYLAEKALKRRTKLHLSKDDITGLRAMLCNIVCTCFFFIELLPLIVFSLCDRFEPSKCGLH